MRSVIRSLAVAAVAVVTALVLALGSTLTPIFAAVATSATTALIMGGTGRPDPDDFPGYVPNVAQYYIYPNSACQPPGCALEGVYTPETAWPVYGGLNAPTWKQSILQGTELFGDAVDEQLATLGPDDNLVLFGYSQSGAILAFQKESLDDLSDEEKEQIEFVVIGNVSRPNGGLNSRVFPVSIPIVEFPFGPPMPTDTGIETTDIAMKWDIIADAPLYVTNPLAMLNALLGFQYVHGTYPYPTAATPDRTPGGYTTEQWQWMMDNPELYPELVDVQEYGDTTYITVTPTVLPLVAPLHGIGLKPLADLIEPALRVLIEQTGYNRSIPFGQDTGFRLIPIFNPVTLAVDLVKAVPQGINQMIAGLRGEPTWIVPAPPETLQDNSSQNAAAEPAPTATQKVSSTDTVTAEPEVAEAAEDVPAVKDDEDEDTDTQTDTDTADQTSAPENPLRAVERGLRDFTDHITKALQPRGADADFDEKPDTDQDTTGGDTKTDDTETDDTKKGYGADDPEHDKAERTDADAAA
jgi:hypothetical protein